ncbi:hypothetical protein GMW39_10180 [Pectobacterium parmentieri]|uniref:hypothetical protein n=1 Tax=Pectobacterium parmentieri TaxID=1905730 RepID=UPI001373D5AC|nr:hypothetical protein [Pectobacterium parmentieri]QHQ16200.1 hypothetical protein GMW39_10180 [Pectobacterium parmentieri]
MTQENHDLSAQSNTGDRAVGEGEGTIEGIKYFTTDSYLFLEMLSATSDVVIIRFDCIAAVVDAGKAGSEVHLLSGSKILVKHYAMSLMEYFSQAFTDVRNKLPESKEFLPKVFISTINKKDKAELSGLKCPI